MKKIKLHLQYKKNIENEQVESIKKKMKLLLKSKGNTEKSNQEEGKGRKIKLMLK